MPNPTSPQRGPARRLALALTLAVAALAPACGGSSSPASEPDPVIATETFTGSLAASGYATQAFQVGQIGLVTATLTSFSPQATITVGFGIGRPSGTACAIILSSDSARVGTVLSGSAAPGTYCVTIYDVGNVQGSNDFLITLTHP